MPIILFGGPVPEWAHLSGWAAIQTTDIHLVAFFGTGRIEKGSSDLLRRSIIAASNPKEELTAS